MTTSSSNDPSTYSAGTTPTGSEQVLANQSGSLVSLTTAQLTQLSYNSLSLWKTYDTVAQMKAGASAAYPRVKWRGYKVAGDGGGGEGVYIAGTYTANESTIFATTAGGYVIRDNPNGHVNVFNCGAFGDGSTADDAAIMLADSIAKVLGKLVYFPSTPNGYLVTQRIDINSRGLIGDVGYIDGNYNGTVVNFRPGSTLTTGATAPANTPTSTAGDNYSCFRFNASYFQVSNITIFGPTVYSLTTLQSGGYVSSTWRWSATLNYADFGLGFAGFEVAGSARGQFSNCYSQNLKHGLLLNSTVGHIRWYNCAFQGLIGVMCYRDSGDYYMEGGSLQGIICGLGFNDLLQAGHYGGIQLTIQQAHGGFGAAGIVQFHDASTPSGSIIGGIDGTFIEFHMEQIGQIGIQMLPGALNGVKFIGTSIDWSATPADSTTSSDAWKFILPSAIAPTEGVQQYGMRLGSVSVVNASGSYFGATDTTAATCSYLAANQHALYIDGIANNITPQQDPLDFGAWSNDVQMGDGSDASFYSTAIKSAFAAARPGCELSPYKATKGDLRRIAGIRPHRNLLKNWEFQTAGLGVTNNALTTNGGNLSTYNSSNTSLTINTLAAVMASDGITEAMISGLVGVNMREFLGMTPYVLKLVCTTSGGVSFVVPTADNPAVVTNRMISRSMFVLANTANGSKSSSVSFHARVAGASNSYVADYTNTLPVNQLQRFDFSEYAAGAPGSANNSYSALQFFGNSLTAGDVLYIMGIMVNTGPCAMYNPDTHPASADPMYLKSGLRQAGRAFVTTTASGGATTTVTIADFLVEVNATAAAGTVMLPAAPFDGEVHVIKKADTSANAVTVNGNGVLIDGASTYVMPGNVRGSVRVQYVGSAATPHWCVM
ncbi:MAG: hypothetical protein ACRYGL_06615 [Janthinobacterium lividum]